jgi:hypothetical protein
MAMRRVPWPKAAAQPYDYRRQNAMSDPLVIYLEDHKAGAGLAIDLLQKMKAGNNDESLSRFCYVRMEVSC